MNNSSPQQRIVAGKTPIIVSPFSPSDMTLGKRAIDVLTKTAGGSKDFDDILARADDVSTFEEIRVYTANKGSNYSQYYYRASVLLNFSSSTLWDFQYEAVINQPSDSMKAEIQTMANNCPPEIVYKISHDGGMTKVYIESGDYESFMDETQGFYNFISSHTAR